MAATVWSRAARLSACVWRWCGTPEGRRCCILLALALLVRLALAPYHGFFGDLDVYASWGLHLGDHFLDFYSFNAAGSYVYHAAGPERGWVYDMPANYPPLSIYVFYAEMRLYMLFAGLAGHGVALGSLSPVAALCMKTATLAADLGTGGLVYLLARRARGPRWALVAAALYAFSPVVLFDGALWGQTDGVITFLTLLALLCAARKQAALSGSLAAASLLFKPQLAVVLPLLLVYLFRWAGWKSSARFLAAFAATAVLVCLPFLLPPRPQVFAMLGNMQRFHVDFASSTAYNVWWFSARFHSAAAPYLGPLSPLVIGWALFGVVLLVAVRVAWHDSSPTTLLFLAAVLALASFVLTAMQFERYLYPAVILLQVAAAGRPRRQRFAAVASATFLGNVGIVLLINLHESPWIDGGFWVAFPDPRYWPFVVTLVIAAANLALLAAVMLAAARPHDRSRAAATALQPLRLFAAALASMPQCTTNRRSGA